MKLNQAAAILLVNFSLAMLSIRRTKFTNLFITVVLAWRGCLVSGTCEQTIKVPISNTGNVLATSKVIILSLDSPINNIVKASGRAKASTGAYSDAYFDFKDDSGNTLDVLNIRVGHGQYKNGSKDFDIPLNNVDAIHMYSKWNSAVLQDLIFTINTCTEAPTETQVPTTLPSKVPSNLPSVVPTTCERTIEVPIGDVNASTVLKTHQLASPMNNVVKAFGTAKAQTHAFSDSYFYFKDASGNTLGFLRIVPGNYQFKDGSKNFDIPLNNVDAIHMYSKWNAAVLSNLVFTINTCTETPTTDTQVPTTLPSMRVSYPPSSVPSIIFSMKPSTESTDLPSALPSVGNSCDGKNKAQCKNLKEFCVFGKNKIAGKCELKKSKYKKDCGQFDAEDACLNESEGNCMWSGKCTHRCDGLAKKDCKKVKNSEDNNRKMCQAKVLSNPCKGCQSKTTCG